MEFKLTSDQYEKFLKWNEHHTCKHKKNPGTVGGRVTFEFTQTSLGLITEVRCICGETLNLTPTDTW